MAKKKSIVSEEEEIEQSFDFQILKMLSDPMRVRIILELLVHNELSTKQLQASLPISRSSLGHHLQKLEENNLITVRIQPKSYSVKFYSISKSLNSKFSLKKAVRKASEEQQSEIIKDAFSSVTSVLQFITNLAYESLIKLRKTSIENVQEKDQNTYYTLEGKENLFVPAQFVIIKQQQVPEFVRSLREFIIKSSSIINDEKELKNEDLPLYAFITTGFPILFKNSVDLPELTTK